MYYLTIIWGSNNVKKRFEKNVWCISIRVKILDYYNQLKKKIEKNEH